MSINRIGRHVCARSLASVTILSLLTWLMPVSLAQTTTATISGVVTDTNGATVSGARITATNVGTNLSRSVTTDSEGRYLIL
ncbi:MAG TPA: carboxypeptidase-like regulatory domain-containing protein, partial [Blastocatellia bacterium]|nr:carboxypeptidase-like regulatory domain-containing protein [Blastocatellia bacterium]